MGGLTPHNVPGARAGRPNWRRKIRRSLDQIKLSPASSREFLETLRYAWR